MSTRSPWPRLVSMLGVLLLLVAAAFGPAGVGADPLRPGPPLDTEVQPGGDPLQRPTRPTGTLNLMLELEDAPSGVAYAAARGRGASVAVAGQAARAQKARAEQAQRAVLGALPRAVPGARPLYQVQTAYNGIAVLADAGTIPQLRGLPGVKAVHVIPLLTRANTASVPFIGAPTAWQSYGGLTGAGIRIGIIDSGIDYVHTNFGGSGSADDYAAAISPANNQPASFPVLNDAGQPIYPTAKVVGGYDFAGDEYNASGSTPAETTPAPDPNPMDCNGHGSHVAGTAGGSGVNADGSTYTGAYDANINFAGLRIGPGVAPQAQLYALRVTGCGNHDTALVPQAIDYATDPNRDGDPRDRLDVINLSLGWIYGSPDDPNAVAADNAALAGVLVAISAGNNGDTYYISGSPGSAARALSVASSVDSTAIVDGFEVTPPGAGQPTVYPASRSALYDWSSPPVTANLYYPATNQYGCDPWEGDDLANIDDQIVLVDWRKAGDAGSPCDSDARATNAYDAGAKGILMVDNRREFEPFFDGNATIPAMYSNKDTGDALKALVAAGTRSTVAIRLSTDYFDRVALVLPELNDTLSDFSSRGPRLGDSGLKPDISAPGQTIFSTSSRSGNRGESRDGTSMAAPHMAGVLALLRQQHPTWTVEELKALAMNTARHDLTTGPGGSGMPYGLGRVGAGRVDVPDAIGTTAVAYLDDGTGTVSVSFGAVEVLGTLQLDKTVRVANKGGAAVTYDLGYDARMEIPGVGYSFPDGRMVRVAAGETATFRVRLSADAAQMRNTRDPSVAPTQAGYPRQWLSEAGGLITLTPTAGGTALRLPVYATARPASKMATAQSQLAFPNATGGAELTLTGQGVDTGADYRTDITSVVTALELAAESPPATLAPRVSERAREADLQYVGVTAARTDPANPSRVNNSTIYFGVATRGNWATPSPRAVRFYIYLDLDRDGAPDYVLVNYSLGLTDVFGTALFNLRSGKAAPQTYINIFSTADRPTAPYNTSVLVLPVNVTGTSQGLNFGSANTRFDYQVVTWSRYADDGPVDVTDVLTYDYANPGLDFQGGIAGTPMYPDRPGDTIPATFNQAAYTANGSQGTLLLHHYNATGNRAQVLPVRLAQTIAFAPLPDRTYGDPPFTVSASASSDLPVSFTASGNCTIGGSTVTLTGVGSCTVTASQGGDATYAPAADVARTFQVRAPGAPPPPSPPPPPAAPDYTLALTASGGGSAAGAGRYPAGAVATLSASPDAGSVFTGWTVDGEFVGWANPLTITMAGDRTVVASFAARPAFPDVPADHAYAEAIAQLAARGIIRGYGDGRFGPADVTLRAQMAALIARAMGWDSEDHGTTFPDRGSVDADLWRNVGTLAFYNVARGYQDGKYRPTAPVLHAQVASFVARAMVAKGHWTEQPDDPALYPNVPAGSGHRADLATYVYYAGALPETEATAAWGGGTGWDRPSTRGWFAQALWQVLDRHWGVDRVE